LTFEESALLMKRFDEGLTGYTYLEEEPAPSVSNGAHGLTELPPAPQTVDGPPRPAAAGVPGPQPAEAEREPIGEGPRPRG
jgi:hypothetical protein